MKLSLPKTTAFALVAASGVFAHEQPPSTAIRGTNANVAEAASPWDEGQGRGGVGVNVGRGDDDDRYYSGGGTCNDGQEEGMEVIKKYWKNNLRSNCDNVRKLKEEANWIKEDYDNNGSNWRDRDYNECKKDGVDAEVRKIEADCSINEVNILFPIFHVFAY